MPLIRCALCPVEFQSTAEHQKHRKTHQAPIQCYLCPKIMDNLKDAKRHIYYHRCAPKPCKICNKMFSQAANLGRHYRNVHKIGAEEEKEEGMSLVSTVFENVFGPIQNFNKVKTEEKKEFFDFKQLGETNGLPVRDTSLTAPSSSSATSSSPPSLPICDSPTFNQVFKAISKGISENKE